VEWGVRGVKQVSSALFVLTAVVMTGMMAFRLPGSSGSAESAVLGAGTGPVPTPTTAPGHKKTYQGPYFVVVVVDAARADEVNLATMPNLAALAQRGTTYSNAWVGQLPSITESSHATIGTGVLPKRHLILGDTWRIPGTRQMSPNLLDSQLTRTGYIGKLIQQAQVPSLAAYVHQRYPGSLVATMSGHKIYAADGLGAGAADFVAFGIQDSRKHFVPAAIPGREPAPSLLENPQLDLPQYPRTPGLEDEWTTTLALKFLFKYHPRLIMINLPEVDTTGHLVGTDATMIQPLMSGVDHEIGRLVAAYTRTGLINQTYFIVTADHGMIPAIHIVPMEQIKSVVTGAGGKPLYIGHGDYCTIWLKNLNAVPRVASALVSARIPNVDAVFMKSPQGKYTLVSPSSWLADPAIAATYRQLLGTINQGESPDLILMYDENTITMTPSFRQMGRKGDHEGATWGAQHIPLIIAGPGIKQRRTSGYPARLVDLAPTVETIMGIQPQHQDGVPLADAMISPPAWAVTAQTARGNRLSPLVAALEREAQLRPNMTP
jgi:arylsulfatase A-like enzyme